MPYQNIDIPKTVTTDATPVTVVVMAIDPGTAITIDYSLVAKTDAGVVKAWNGVRTMQRIGSAAPVPVGTAIAPDIDPATGAPTWTVSAGASGNNFALTFTGAAATTIEWEGHISAMAIT